MLLRKTFFESALAVAVLIFVSCSCGTNASPGERAENFPSSKTSENPGDDYTLGESDVERDLSPDIDEEDLAEATVGNTEFAFDLYSEIKEDEENR